MKDTLQIGKEEMFKAIRELYNEYQLPRLNIEQNEWQAFFKVTAEYFDVPELFEDYPIALNIVIRRAINLALIDGAKEIKINYLIDALQDLTAFHVYQNEVEKMQDNIKKNIEEQKEKKYIKK